MVDFNSETTVGVSAIDIFRVLILQRRNDLIDSIEAYRKIENNSNPDTDIIRSRLFSLFLEVQSMIKRRNKEEYDKLREAVESEEYSELLEAFVTINDFLDTIQLIKLDIKKVYDKTRTSVEDNEKGI